MTDPTAPVVHEVSNTENEKKSDVDLESPQKVIQEEPTTQARAGTNETSSPAVQQQQQHQQQKQKQPSGQPPVTLDEEPTTPSNDPTGLSPSSFATLDNKGSTTVTFDDEEQVLLLSQPNNGQENGDDVVERVADAPTELERPNFPTLARASTTPWLMTIFLPLVCLATHALFYYGQTATMWKLRLFADIDIHGKATSDIARAAFDAAGLDLNQHYEYHDDRDVSTFTYWFAIQELWDAKKMPSKTLPRLAAGLLVIFSGVWPHLKLFLLNVTFLCARGGAGRSRLLSILGTLGKWSLADVLAVCVMVGVLHLDWDVDPEAIKHGVIEDLPEILTVVHSMYQTHDVCDYLLHWKCSEQKKLVRKAKCTACLTAVHKVFEDSTWAQTTGRTIVKGVDTSGGGLATLRVEGMMGIYIFCGAVILSIVLSIIVDWYDHKAQLDNLRRQQVSSRLQDFLDSSPSSFEAPLLSGEDVGFDDDEETEEHQRLPLPLELDSGVDQSATSTQTRGRRRRRGQRQRQRPRRQMYRPGQNDHEGSNVFLFSWTFMIVSVVSAVAVYYAVQLPSMERQVKGAAPKMLHDILGVDWSLKYSLHSLMKTTGAAGGWDNLLMWTFSLFCVLGPIVRAILCVAAGFSDKWPGLQNSVVIPITTCVNFIGAFCAWEVFAVAIVMVDMLMPTITNTIVHSPICDQISDDGSCLQVEFNILTDSFRWIIIGGVILSATSWAAYSTGNKKQHSGYVQRLEVTPSQMDEAYGNYNYSMIQ